MIMMRMVMTIYKEDLVDSGGLSVSTTLAPLLRLLFGLSTRDQPVPPLTPAFRSVSFWPTTP